MDIHPVITEHGLLIGLGDDDHTQYLRADGTRDLAGNWDLGGYNLTNGGDITSTGVGTFGSLVVDNIEIDDVVIVSTGTSELEIGSAGAQYLLLTAGVPTGNGLIYIQSTNFNVGADGDVDCAGTNPDITITGTNSAYVRALETDSAVDHDTRIYSSSTGCYIGAFSNHDCIITANGAEVARASVGGAFSTQAGITDGAASSFTTGTTIGNLTLANGSITDSSGAISFGAMDLLSTGNLTIQGIFTTGFVSNFGGGDADTLFAFDAADSFYFGAGGAQLCSMRYQQKIKQILFNGEQNDVNFKVYTSGSAATFHIDGGSDRVGIGTGTPATKLQVIGDVRFGDNTNDLLISSTGVVTMAGTAKVKKTRTFTFNYRNITAKGKPTLVNQGVFYGFSLPIYNNDDEELFACRCFDADWDGTTDPVIYLGGWLDTANTSKKFNLQVSVETADFVSNDVVPATTNDYATETTTGTWAQYTSFMVTFTVDASAIGLAVGQPFAIRMRRLAASADEIAGEVVIEGASLEYVANKLGGAT